VERSPGNLVEEGHAIGDPLRPSASAAVTRQSVSSSPPDYRSIQSQASGTLGLRDDPRSRTERGAQHPRARHIPQMSLTTETAVSDDDTYPANADVVQGGRSIRCNGPAAVRAL
jgi:hypothetical protein